MDEWMEDFDYFLSKFGPATYREPIEPSVIETYRGILPDLLLEIWERESLAAYDEGRFWLTNPAAHQEVLEAYTKGTPIHHPDNYVIARSAFGLMYVWNKDVGRLATIYPFDSYIVQNWKGDYPPADKLNFKMGSFFVAMSKEFLYQKDERGTDLFERCLKRFGPLAPHEMYGYIVPLSLEGNNRLQNMYKTDLKSYLLKLASIQNIHMFDYNRCLEIEAEENQRNKLAFMFNG